MTSSDHQLNSQILGSLPVVNSFLDRLGVNRLLDDAVPADPRSQLPPALVLGVVLRSVIEERMPLYALREWVAERDPKLLGLPDPDAAALLNDDRVGRALERLFDADRAKLQTAIVVQAIRKFNIDCSEFHNDSTSLTFAGNYRAADGGMRRGQPTAKITFGHNKDHRSDLKQLLWILTVSADGAVPVHYSVDDGNTADTETHIDTWNLLQQLAGRPDFLYVADSKLCTHDNMAHINREHGRFLTILPRTRSEDATFREWIQTHTPEWQMIRQDVGRDGQPDAYFMVEAPWPSGEGFRVAWVLSSAKARHDADSRQSRIAQASGRLDALRERLLSPKARIRTREGADDVARAILRETDTADWFTVRLGENTEHRYRQTVRGRPGASTTYRRDDHTRILLTWEVREDRVANDAKADGMFPLITNCRDLALGELLERYKYQPFLEHRHQQFKSGLHVTPMWLKNVDRIEGFLFLDFIALLVRSLIEHEIRGRMNDHDITTLPIYPEHRDCPAPTAERILTIFAPIQRHHLLTNGRLVQTFEPEFNSNQRRLLRLLDLSPSVYRATA